MRRSPLGILGTAGIGLGCAGMAAMLPSAATGALGVLGITGSGALARTLSPIAEPLLIASAVLILLSALACSRLVVILTGVGAVLLYLSMFQLATGGASGRRSSMSMMTMQQPHHQSALHANAATFYLGLALLIGAATLRLWRQRRHECRPILRIPPLRTAHH